MESVEGIVYLYGLVNFYSKLEEMKKREDLLVKGTMFHYRGTLS